jgi:hypothetical protein
MSATHGLLSRESPAHSTGAPRIWRATAQGRAGSRWRAGGSPLGVGDGGGLVTPPPDADTRTGERVVEVQPDGGGLSTPLPCRSNSEGDVFRAAAVTRDCALAAPPTWAPVDLGTGTGHLDPVPPALQDRAQPKTSKINPSDGHRGWRESAC